MPFHMIKVLADHIGVTLITPIREICKWQSYWILMLFIVFDHAWIDISAATNYFGLQTNPVFFCVSTPVAWCSDRNVLEFFNWSNELPWYTMGAFLDWFDCKESHKRTNFIRIGFLLFLFIFLIDLKVIQLCLQITDFVLDCAINLFFLLFGLRQCNSFAVLRHFRKLVLPTTVFSKFSNNIVAFSL